jgi:hypothetical protein
MIDQGARWRSGARPSSNAPAGYAPSVAGENLIAFDLDRLFRADRRPTLILAYPRAGRPAFAHYRKPAVCGRMIAPVGAACRRSNRLGGADANVRLTTLRRVQDAIARARRAPVIVAFAGGGGSARSCRIMVCCRGRWARARRRVTPPPAGIGANRLGATTPDQSATLMIRQLVCFAVDSGWILAFY